MPGQILNQSFMNGNRLTNSIPHQDPNQSSENNGWLIKIGDFTHSDIKGFEKYIPVDRFREIIDCPKVPNDMKSIGTAIISPRSGLIEFLIPPRAYIGNVMLKIFGNAKGSSSEKRVIDVIELIRISRINTTKSVPILEKLQFKNCTLMSCVLDTVWGGSRLYTGSYTMRTEEIIEYNAGGKAGSGFSSFNFETGESEDSIKQEKLPNTTKPDAKTSDGGAGGAPGKPAQKGPDGKSNSKNLKEEKGVAGSKDSTAKKSDPAGDKSAAKKPTADTKAAQGKNNDPSKSSVQGKDAGKGNMPVDNKKNDKNIKNADGKHGEKGPNTAKKGPDGKVANQKNPDGKAVNKKGPDAKKDHDGKNVAQKHTPQTKKQIEAQKKLDTKKAIESQKRLDAAKKASEGGIKVSLSSKGLGGAIAGAMAGAAAVTAVGVLASAVGGTIAGVAAAAGVAALLGSGGGIMGKLKKFGKIAAVGALIAAGAALLFAGFKAIKKALSRRSKAKESYPSAAQKQQMKEEENRRKAREKARAAEQKQREERQRNMEAERKKQRDLEEANRENLRKENARREEIAKNNRAKNENHQDNKSNDNDHKSSEEKSNK